MKKVFLACAALLSLTILPTAYSQPGECYDVGVSFANQRASILCSPDARLPYSTIRVSRACVKAAISGCKDTLVSAIRSLQDSGDCKLRPFTVLAGELLKNRECRKLLDFAEE
jgi:hypothetical protein